MNVMRKLVDQLQAWNFRVCGIFVLDSHFMVDGGKFLSGAMATLSCMVNLELPAVNVLSKVDLLSGSSKRQLDQFLSPDTALLTSSVHTPPDRWGSKYHGLSEALGRLLDDYSLVKFFPLDITNEENVQDLLIFVDNTIQYGEDLEVKTRDFEYPDQDDDEGDGNYEQG